MIHIRRADLFDKHTFDVVRSAGSTDYNYANPIRRDVVNTGLAGTCRCLKDAPILRLVTQATIPQFGALVLQLEVTTGRLTLLFRFRTDNAGPWILHWYVAFETARTFY